jgi:outer membrane protein with beta-barrel domain
LKMMKSAFLCVAICSAFAPAASAQMTWTDKGFVNLSVGVQVGSHTLDTTRTFDLYDEQGTVSSSQKVKSGGLFDVSAGYKVWHNLAVAVGYSRTSSKADATISASVPDPGFFDSPRAVTSSASGLKHTENVINLSGVWMVPVTDKIDVGLSAGPSVFSVKQDIPGSLTATEPGPTVSVAVDSVKKSTVGINFGVDVAYLINKRYGVGGLARYTWGSVDLDGAGDKLTVGGFQVGAGLRVRF